MLLVTLLACFASEEPAPPPPHRGDMLLTSWVRRIVADPDATASAIVCEDGAAIAAVGEVPAMPVPKQVCWSTLRFPGRTDAVRVSELEFASAEAAWRARDLLLERGDGGDPRDSCGECKALVSGWTEGSLLYWVTTRALAFEADGCEAIRAFGETKPKGMHRCPAVPPPSLPSLPAAPFSVAEWSVSRLVPPSRLTLAASTFDLADLDLPGGGVREERGGVEVVAERVDVRVGDVSIGGGVVDGLREGSRVYLAPALTETDRETYAAVEARYREWQLACPAGPGPGCHDGVGHSLARIVRIARVEADTVSAWIGTSEYSSGAAHSNNRLACGTWSRRTGKRLTLSDVLGAAEAGRRWAAFQRIRAAGEARSDADEEAWYRLGLYDLRNAAWPSGPDTVELLLDGEADPIICLPDDVGRGGTTYVYRLGAP